VPQSGRSYRNGGPGTAQHLGEKLMWDRKFVRPRTSGAEEQPWREALLHLMSCVAACGLSGCSELRLSVAQNETMEASMEIEFFSGRLYGAVKTMTSELHIDAVQRPFDSQQGWCPDYRLITKYRDLDLGTIVERGGHGGESIFDEEEVVDQLAGRLELLPERKSRRAKVETLYRACVQIPK
jgi:hypothetical protein